MQWNINRNRYILVHEDAFENVICKMAGILFDPNVLNDICARGTRCCGVGVAQTQITHLVWMYPRIAFKFSYILYIQVMCYHGIRVFFWAIVSNSYHAKENACLYHIMQCVNMVTPGTWYDIIPVKTRIFKCNWPALLEATGSVQNHYQNGWWLIDTWWLYKIDPVLHDALQCIVENGSNLRA